jgi:hypothetical protein
MEVGMIRLIFSVRWITMLALGLWFGCAQAQTNPHFVLTVGPTQLSAGEGNNEIVPTITIDPLGGMNRNGLPTKTLNGNGSNGPSSASVAVKVLNPENLSTPEHFQIMQTVGAPGGDITQSIVSFSATSNIKTSIGVQSVLYVKYPSDHVLDINLINTGISIQFSDGTRLFKCTASPPFPTPPCIVVTPDGFTVTWSMQSSSATFVVGSLLLTLADAPYDATLTTDIEVIQDSITLNNTTLGQQNGVWVNGIANGAQWNHETFSPQNSAEFPTPGSSDSVTIPMSGNVQKSPPGTQNGNEVVAFALQRPVAIQTDVPWTDFTDNIQLTFNNEIEVHIQFWILQTPHANGPDAQIFVAQSIYRMQHTGIKPVLAGIGDETSDPAAAQFLSFTCDTLPSQQQQLRQLQSHWFNAEAVNVYFVNLVDVHKGGTIAQSCQTGEPIPGLNMGGIVISSHPNPDTLAHELGHQMGLAHVGGDRSVVLDFNGNNLMWGNGLARSTDFLTEGQIFRMHLSTYSLLNSGLRPGLLKRDCELEESLNLIFFAYAFDTPTLGCPALNKRIFAEGSQQPN